MPVPFDRSVFINCPFDDDYAPILQAIAFCVTFMGFSPRLAPENGDNAVPRLERILELIRSSKYGIHDLSRCKAKKKGEFARMNMPFELGLDHGCKRYGGGELESKMILVLEERAYEYQRSLSDISGWDIKPHGANYERAIKAVRAWLVHVAGAPNVGPAHIIGKYADFWEWYWERELSQGASEEDIREYPTHEVILAMEEWVNIVDFIG